MPPKLLMLILMQTNTESCAPIPPPLHLALHLLLLLLLPRLDLLLPVLARGEARCRMVAARKMLLQRGRPTVTDLAGACGRGSLLLNLFVNLLLVQRLIFHPCSSPPSSTEQHQALRHPPPEYDKTDGKRNPLATHAVPAKRS